MTITSTQPLSALELSNQCVVVCDLRKWQNAESAAWLMLKGSQDEVGEALARLLAETRVERLEDFGGVCETFLCSADQYLPTPRRIRGVSAVFSFTPKKKLLAEGNEMARVSRASGYLALVITSQKHDKFGKVWVMRGLLRHLRGEPMTYYDDTNTVVDELKTADEGSRIVAIHVQAPGFEEHVAQFADRVITQEQYQKEVLDPTADTGG